MVFVVKKSIEILEMLEIKVLHSLLNVSLNIGLCAFLVFLEFCDNMSSIRYICPVSNNSLKDQELSTESDN